MMSVVGMAAGDRDAARADEAAADEICASVFSGLLDPLSWCFAEDAELDIVDVADDGTDEDSDERSFSFGSELLRLELTLPVLLVDDPMPLVLPLLVPPLDLDDLELLSLCEDEDDDEDDEGSLSCPLFVPDNLFTFLLYLSFSLVLLLEEDALVLLLFPGIVLLPAFPDPIPGIPEDDDDVVDWLPIPIALLPPLTIPLDGPEVDEDPAELFEALEDFLCFEDDDDDDAEVDDGPPISPPGIRLLDFMLLLPPPPLPPLLPPPMVFPLECCCPDGGSSSFSGDDGPSLEFVSWLIGLYGGIVLTLPPFFNLL